MQDYNTEEMRTASPDSIFQAQRKPSKKALENLRKWRDRQARDDWDKEALDAVIRYLETEVGQ